jgi:hypothetical protein
MRWSKLLKTIAVSLGLFLVAVAILWIVVGANAS